jgi:DNA-binding NarL/FixJ family response regulator
MPTILLVEDHDAVRESLCEWLQVKFPLHRVMGVGCGEDAVALASAERLDVVLMDLALPGMNGIEATRLIRLAQPAAKVVILSMREDTSYRVDAQGAGASAYVTKRAMQAELIPTLVDLLGTEHCASPAE